MKVSAELIDDGKGAAITFDEVMTPEQRTFLVHSIAEELKGLRALRIHDGKTSDGRNLLTGQGRHGTTARYTKGYERRKLSKGPRAPYSPEDRFTYTGEMLTSQHIEAKGDVAEIRFGGDNANKAIANDTRRPFIGFTSAELDLAVAEAVKHMEKVS